MRIIKFSSIALLVLILFFGCKENSSKGLSAFENENRSLSDAKTETLMIKEISDVSETTETAEVQDQKIIKSASLAFETQELDATHRKILQLAQQYKGIVQEDNSGKSYDRIYRNIIIRIPSENFQKIVDGISDGVKYFDRREISRQDVTEEFVDIEARLKAKRELEKRYLELLRQAKNVKEMLEIERELSLIREEIEAKQGRLQYLQSRVSMSTIAIEFYKTTAETGVTVSYGQKIKNALLGGWEGVSVFFLGLLYLWPFFLIGLLIILFIRFYVKKKKRINNKSI
jgi:hypothetical protein